METIRGALKKIIFSNDSNGFMILALTTDAGEVTATGTFFEMAKGEEITLTGEFINHPKYGRQFRTDSFTASRSFSREGVTAYLEDFLEGVGTVIAERMWEAFGPQVFEVIESAPEKLMAVKGVTRPVMEKIAASYRESSQLRQVFVDLAGIGVSHAAAVKLFKTYGPAASAVVRNNPYRLISDISGISFKRADEIAMRAGVAPDSPQRVDAAIIFVAGANLAAGHCYTDEAQLAAQTAGYLQSVSAEDVTGRIAECADQGTLSVERTASGARCYLPWILECEVNAAGRLSRMTSPAAGPSGDVTRMLSDYEEMTGIRLEETQRRAVLGAVSSSLSIITGGPGTGKTTIINAIVHCLRRQGRTAALAAPTGRAAKRVSQACASPAQTVHRLLEWGGEAWENPLGEPFRRNGDNPLDEDVIIVDEVSMMDLPLFSSLISAVDPSRTALVLVGDADQLPAVGPGSVLRDLIACGLFPVTRLSFVFRQREGGELSMAAHQINSGELPDLEKSQGELIFLPAGSQEEIFSIIMGMFETNAYGVRELALSDRLQVISPVKRGSAGVVSLNGALQGLLNPPGPSKPELARAPHALRLNDRVMQTKNDYSAHWTNPVTGEEGEGVFNGDIGVVSGVDAVRRVITVLFDSERVVELDFTAATETLSLAYALTVHKSQGCEFDTVVLPVFAAAPFFLTRNLLYTALTRARRRAVIVGQRSVLAQMAANSLITQRRSGLTERIIPLQ